MDGRILIKNIMEEKTIEELEQELEELRESNKASWDTYGSELCAGDMIGKEQALEKEILIRKGLFVEEPDQSLKLDDDLLLHLIGGDGKRVTVRQGRRDIELGNLLFIGARDNTLRYIVGVTEVRHLRMVDVPDDVVEAEGFKNWTDFYEDMKIFYPDLELTDEVTVIFYEIADVTTQ
jgi:hypothetical protein